MESIVFIHGRTLEPSVWSYQVEALKEKFKCTCVDLTDCKSMEQMSRVVLGHSFDFVVGHSMGGYVALDIMRRAPHRVTALVLLNSSARADTQEQKLARIASINMGEEAYITGLHQDQTYLNSLATSNLSNFELVKEMRMSALRLGFRTHVNHQTACMSRLSSLDILPHIKVPVLITSGADDKLVPLEHQIELVDNIPVAKHVIFDSCGHMTPLEVPQLLYAALKNFFEHLAIGV